MKTTVKVSVYQPAEARSFLLGLPRNIKHIAIAAMGKQGEYYLRANTEPPYKKVTRMEAYGCVFFTDKQRRFFFWALKSGRISVPYRRTHETREGWKLKTKPESLEFSNASEGSQWTIGKNQTRMSALIGWKHAQVLLEEGIPSMVASAKDAIDTYFEQRPWR